MFATRRALSFSDAIISLANPFRLAGRRNCFLTAVDYGHDTEIVRRAC